MTSGRARLVFLSFLFFPVFYVIPQEVGDTGAKGYLHEVGFSFTISLQLIYIFFETAVHRTGYSITKLHIMHVSIRSRRPPVGSHDFSLGFLSSGLDGKLSGLRSYRFSSEKMPKSVPTLFPSCRWFN